MASHSDILRTGNGHRVPAALCIEIAGVRIALRCEGVGLVPAAGNSLQPFLVTHRSPQTSLVCDWGLPIDTGETEPLFDSGAVWKAFRIGDALLFQFFSGDFGPLPYKELQLSGDLASGRITVHSALRRRHRRVDPLEYPLDELLFMHFLSRNNGVELHACGVIDTQRHGHLFIGHSGAGKSTLARLWHETRRATVLSDDRIIIRFVNGHPWIFGTPWHGDGDFCQATGAPLHRAWIVEHGSPEVLDSPCENAVPEAQAVSRLLAFSFLPHYDRGAIRHALSFFERLVSRVPVREIAYWPDPDIIDYFEDSVCESSGRLSG